MNWFNEVGELVKEIPHAAIQDCSVRGDVSEFVDFWQKKLDFVAPKDLALPYLKSMGAWEDEMDTKTDEEINRIILWLACCDLREYGEFILSL